MKLKGTILALFVLLPAAAQSDVFRCDGAGTVEFSQTPCGAEAKVLKVLEHAADYRPSSPPSSNSRKPRAKEIKLVGDQCRMRGESLVYTGKILNRTRYTVIVGVDFSFTRRQSVYDVDHEQFRIPPWGYRLFEAIGPFRTRANRCAAQWWIEDHS